MRRVTKLHSALALFFLAIPAVLLAQKPGPATRATRPGGPGRWTTGAPPGYPIGTIETGPNWAVPPGYPVTGPIITIPGWDPPPGYPGMDPPSNPIAPPPNPAPTTTGPPPAPPDNQGTWTPPTISRHFSHVRVVMVGYGRQANTPFGQWLLPQAIDGVIGDAPDHPLIASISPSTMRLLYSNTSNLYGSANSSDGTDPISDWTNYATANGYNIEDAFLHTALPPSPANRLPSQYGPTRPATNPSNAHFRAWAIDYHKRLLAANPSSTGVFMDNSGRSFYLPQGAPQPIEGIANWLTDYGTLMGQIALTIPSGNLVLNADPAGADAVIRGWPFVFHEASIRPLAASHTDFVQLAGWVAHNRELTDPPPLMIFDTNPSIRNTDGSTGAGNQTDPRTEIASLAYYYMLADPASTFICPWGGYDTMGDWSTHWFGAIAYNLGKPKADWYEFANGSDPTATAASPLKYKVFARDYKGALVLYKPLSFSRWGAPVIFGPTDDTSATTHPLPGNYLPLGADGTLGAPTSAVTLRNGEGAILVPAGAASQPAPPALTLPPPAAPATSPPAPAAPATSPPGPAAPVAVTEPPSAPPPKNPYYTNPIERRR